MSFESEVDDIEANVIEGGPPFFSRPGGKIFIIWLIFTAIGVLIGIYAPHHLIPEQLSPEGGDVWATLVFFTVLAAPVAALCYGVAFYSLLAWRHRGTGDEPPPDGPPQRGNGPVTVLWLAVSGVLVVVLLFWGITVWSAQQITHPNTLQVNVTGQQWLWSFEYPGTQATSRTMELPINRPVQFNVTSEDVVHGFWLSSMGVEVDANPAEVTVIRSTPNRLGSFTLQCSNLCGLYHAFMYTQVKIVTQQQFAQWLVTQGATATEAAKTAGLSSTAVTAAKVTSAP